jgi:hypothetical protein
MSDELNDLDISTMVPEEEFGPYCEHCGEELDWEECDQCGGDGEFDWEDLQFEDPLWYQPGDTEECAQCRGEGGWWWCLNKQCKEKA